MGMGRFGWAKKALKEGRTAINSKDKDNNSFTPSASSDLSIPHVSLPCVEPLLNMHQFNGLFETTSVEPRNGHSTTVVDSHPSEIAPQPPPSPTNGETATSEWSAVGHAAATGKSGRVIHNLQEEIARLKRECSVYRARAEETQRMNEVFKTQVQNMTEQLRNLELANEMNLNSITRKDKKIDSLRTEVQSEKDRRQQAEGETSKAQHLMTESRDNFRRKTAELNEIADHARTQYDALAQSSQRERAEMQRKFQTIRSDIASLKDTSGQRNVRLERLDAVMAQKNREIEASRENFDKLFEEYTAYKKAHDDEVRGMIERGRQHEGKSDAAFASLRETEGRMKWAIQQQEMNQERG